MHLRPSRALSAGQRALTARRILVQVAKLLCARLRHQRNHGVEYDAESLPSARVSIRLVLILAVASSAPQLHTLDNTMPLLCGVVPLEFSVHMRPLLKSLYGLKQGHFSINAARFHVGVGTLKRLALVMRAFVVGLPPAG